MLKVKLIVTALTLGVLCLLPARAQAIEVGALAPAFKLPSVEGGEISLADFKGRLVLLKLATTWCPTCKELSGEIEKVGEFLKEQNVVVLDVFVQDSQATVEKYLAGKKFPMVFHALLDDGQAYRGYSVYLIPRLLVIDAEQKVRFDSSGRNVTAADLRAMVTEFNAPPAVKGAS